MSASKPSAWLMAATISASESDAGFAVRWFESSITPLVAVSVQRATSTMVPSGSGSKREKSI